MEKRNIYFVVSHPIQYFVPLYRSLAEREEVSLLVIYLTEDTIKGGKDKQFGVNFTWDIPLLDGYSYVFLPNRTWRKTGSGRIWSYINPGIIQQLCSLPPGLVVFSGWSSITDLIGYLVVKFTKHKSAIRCDAPFLQEGNKTGFRKIIRRITLSKIIFKYFIDVFIFIGKQNYKFYKSFNVPDLKLISSPFSVDNNRFFHGNGLSGNTLTRMGMGILDNDFVIIFTGKLIGVKSPLDIVKAFQILPVKYKKLLLVGDGELKVEIEDYIYTNQLQGVICTGFINQAILPEYYRLADVFVLASSSETWGLSVNEAMACGLPVVVSDAVGCGEDLVRKGENGFIYSQGNIRELSETLYKVFLDKNSKNIMGAESLNIIRNYSVEASAEGILEAWRRSGLNEYTKS